MEGGRMLINLEGSIRGSSWTSAPRFVGSGGSSSVRSTTGLATVVRARLAGGVSNCFGTGPFSPIGVMMGLAEVNKMVGMGEVRGVV